MSADPVVRPPRAHWVVWLFAAVGLIGLVCVIGLFALMLGFRRDFEPAKVASETKHETVFTLSAAQEVQGTNLLRFDVEVSGRSSGSSPYSAGGRSDQRNLLLVDRTTGVSRRILPDNERRISEVRFLPAIAELVDQGGGSDLTVDRSGEADSVAPAAYYLIELERADRSDLKDVLVGTLAGGRQSLVMAEIDGIDSVWMQSPTLIGLIVRERLGLYYRVVDIASLKVIRSRRIEIG